METGNSIKEMFAEYASAFSKLDLQNHGKFFAESFIMAGPNGVISQQRDEFLKNASQAADFYRSVGQKSTEILSMQETPLSNEYVMVKVHWGAWFEKTGDKPIEFDVTYIVHLADRHPEIIAAISH